MIAIYYNKSMSRIIVLPSFSDERGSLTVLEKIMPFDIKRIFYIYGVQAGASRGGHGHHKAQMGLVCIKGSCKVRVNNGRTETYYTLDNPNSLLLLAPEDWHEMTGFTHDAILLVLSSEYYDKDDYIYEEPKMKNQNQK